ncbi:GAF and ANTAR domain-containing protein [Nocardia sp. NBC_00565]|uniref:GAF and ANTAR domain-containing protein n=1 Tax=Nocardia sp. NBC_00565 TaxID=2975993 RepID=UPI002E80EFE4|nr:GAF and ANTAR domain-containing protein [Nocardia sp. NBC_00565]WUC05221.1 GAF and ANTAR domain-containing protein [Nocardia sp. NBC_00565]
MGPASDDRHRDRCTEPLPHSTQLLRILVRAVDALASDFDVVELCQQLLEACTEVTGAADAGLLLADQRGDLQVLASTTEAPRLLELLHHEGPGQLAYRSKSPATVPDLRTAGDRWPEFAPAALAAGFGSAYAVPLRLHHDSIGALTIFAAPAAALGHLSLRIGQILADIAAIGVAHHIVLAHAATIHVQLPTALNTRVTIEQAKGVLAERGSRDMDLAFELMRSHARATGLRLTDIAGDIIEGRVDLTADAKD